MSIARNTAFYSRNCKLLAATILFFFVLVGRPAHCVTLNNPFDSQPMYTVLGTDKYFKEKDKGEIRFYLTPFYQQTTTARNDDGKKVPAGERLGQWNMLGLLFGANTMAPKGWNDTNYKYLNPAYESVTNTTNAKQEPVISRYKGGQVKDATLPLTTSANFSPEIHKWAYVSVPTDYEKFGLRSQLNFDFGFGLGLAIRGGIADVKQTMEGFNLEQQFLLDAGFTVPNSTLTASPTPAPDDAKLLYNNFFAPAKRAGVFSDLELDVKSFHKTAAEDIHAEFFWNFPFDSEDKTGNVAVTIIPRFSIGAWLPAGTERNQNNPFSVPSGNDGFFGITADFSLGFDFPVLPKEGEQSLQFLIGGGLLGSAEKNIVSYRFPSDPLQQGIFPWKVSSVDKRPGITWHLDASMKAEEFIEGLSVFIDYIYTQHLRDKFTLKETNSDRLKAFGAGVDLATRQSSWRNQQVNLGFNYALSSVVALGLAAQGHISGTRVYRATTVLGSMSLTF